MKQQNDLGDGWVAKYLNNDGYLMITVVILALIIAMNIKGFLLFLGMVFIVGMTINSLVMSFSTRRREKERWKRRA